MLRRRRPVTVREKTTKRGTCTVYTFSDYPAYLRWLKERLHLCDEHEKTD